MNGVLFVFAFGLVQAQVKGPPEVEEGYRERYVAKEGDTVKMICPITGSPKPIIEWYQDDHMIMSTWDRFRVNRKYLKLRGAILQDSGVFVCKGVNGFGSQQVQMHLVVKDQEEVIRLTEEKDMSSPSPAIGPIIVRTTAVSESGLHKSLGETLKLECLVEGVPTPTIVWYKDEDILLTPNLRTDRTQTLLLVPNLQLKDSGKYRCKAMNPHGEVEAVFPVQVYERLIAPTVLGAPKENLTSTVGDSIAFHCRVHSTGPTQIKWLKEVQKHQEPRNVAKTINVFNYTFEILPHFSADSNSQTNVHNSSVVLRHLGHDHAGRYICLANNPEGHAHKEIFLKIRTDHGQKAVPLPVPAPSDALPLTLFITIPLLSTALVCLILATVCIRRNASVQRSPSLLGKVITMATAAGSTTSGSSKVDNNGENPYMEVEKWVEVTNKANQTPSHWVYSSDVPAPPPLESGYVNVRLPSVSSMRSASPNTFNTYLVDYSMPKDSDSMFSTPLMSAHNTPLMPHRELIRSGKFGLRLNPSSSLPVTPQRFGGGQPFGGSGQAVVGQPFGHTVGVGQSANIGHLGYSPQPFYAVVRPGSGRSSSELVRPGSGRSSGELYKPPSDHFYFKIKDGKTEFI